MAKYLLEIGTEELPAPYIPQAEAQLAESIRQQLTEHHLDFGSITTMSTPRRLTLFVDQVAPMQRTVEKSVKGPPVKSSFDQNGKPLSAAAGFASKHNLKVDDLAKETVNDIEYLVAHLKIPGIKAQKVLSKIVPDVIKQLSGERMMRWGTLDLKFSRPIRWIVSLLDSEVVPFQFAQVEAGRTSMGHRTLSRGRVDISSVDKYLETTRKEGVIVDPAERRKLIEQQVTELATKAKGKAGHMQGSLLNEVVNLTENPTAIMGNFAPEYLELPDLLIETIMIHHQRYFPIEKSNSSKADGSAEISGNLLPYFVAISNNTAHGAEQKTRLGNERVLKARLADGRFFYVDDQKVSLAERRKALEQLTFQEGLGSYESKISRLLKGAELVAEQLKLAKDEANNLNRAISLCKADLVSNLVRELPELQGYVGSWYAAREKEPQPVVTAIASHYSPRFAEDRIPNDLLGKLISLLDKLDSVAGAIAMGRKPSSSGDPFAIRRQTQGLIDIGLSLDRPVNISLLSKCFIESLPKENNHKQSAEVVLSELLDFLRQRLHARILEDGYNRHVVEAVTATREPLENLPDLRARLTALKSFVDERSNHDVLQIGVRIANIVGGEEASDLEESQFSEPAEKMLFKSVLDFQAFRDLSPPSLCGPSNNPYESELTQLQPIVQPVISFFDQVMVNDEDPVKRRARRSLLANIDKRLRRIADFSKLQPLLN